MTIQTPEWVKEAVFYQIFPDRFARSQRVIKPSNLETWDAPPTPHGFKGGDLLGIVEHLDYLENLGVNALYLNPIFQSASNHRYHTHDYYRVDPLLGGDPALRELLDTAHSRGIRVILDGVFNHASRGFFQFNHILECGERSPYLDWFTIKGFPLNAYDPTRKPNYVAWFGLHALPKLNTANPQVREFIFDVAVHWIRFGIDGWRLDVPNEINDDMFWQEFRQRVKEANPDAYLVGEIWDDARRWLQGDQFDAVMNYVFSRACIAFFGRHSVSSLSPGDGFPPLKPLDAAGFAQTIEDALSRYNWEITSVQMNLLGSHDTPRFLTMVGEDDSALKLAVLFQMTMPGAPSVYYGDEIGLIGGPDPACRNAMPQNQSGTEGELFDFFREAIHLRKAHPVLRCGTYHTLLADHEQYTFERVLGGERVIAAFNVARDEQTLNIPMERADGPLRILFGHVVHIGGDTHTLIMRLPPRTGVVVALDA